MPNNQLSDFVSHVRDGVTQQLDRLGEIIPEQKPPRNAPTFEDYHAQAQAHLQAHPDDDTFKTAYQSAVAQYQAAKGA